MDKTVDNAKRCNELVDSLFNLRADHRCEGERLAKLRAALVTALLEMCTSMKVAEDVVDKVIAEEEWVPAPATLRKWLRDLNYLEADVSERLDREIQASVEARNREWNEQRAKAALDE